MKYTYGEDTLFTQAIDDGDYDSFYVRRVLPKEEAEPMLAKCSDEYRAGYLLGFFASFADHELPKEWFDEVVSLREEHPR